MPDEPRIPTKRAADAIGMPEATLRLWLRPHRNEASDDGYPIATVLRVLTAHGKDVARATLEGAAATRPMRPRKDEPAQGAQIVAAPDAALVAFMDAMRVQQETQAAILDTQRALLAELRAQGEAQRNAQAVAAPPWWLRLLRRLRA